MNKEIKSDTSELYLTFKLLKRRYRSAEDSEDLKRMEYFNQPFVHGNDIALMDDIDLPKPLALYSLSSQFIAYDKDKKKEPTPISEKFEPFAV